VLGAVQRHVGVEHVPPAQAHRRRVRELREQRFENLGVVLRQSLLHRRRRVAFAGRRVAFATGDLPATLGGDPLGSDDSAKLRPQTAPDCVSIACTTSMPLSHKAFQSLLDERLRVDVRVVDGGS